MDLPLLFLLLYPLSYCAFFVGGTLQQLLPNFILSQLVRMRKLLTLFLFVCTVHFTTKAQTNWCGTDHYTDQLLLENPMYQEKFQALQESLQEQAGMPAPRSGTIHIIPVVFHVLWDDCDDNISKAQLEDALRVVNEDFRRLNTDTSETRDIFKPVAADAEIEFRLARIDPNGNPTDGIVRVQTSLTVNAGNNVKSLSYWPSSKYLNIWIVRSIASSSTVGITLGYAQFPESGPWTTYGVVMRHDQTGTIGSSNADGRTLTHEIGHCLNLYHTFQSGCGSSCSFSGDNVCDTPPSSEAFFDCSFSHNSCSNDASGSQSAFSSNVPDMIENYMSYNSCQNVFTQGQKARMKNTLNSVSTLVNLTSEANLIATGVSGLVEANYTVSERIACEGDALVFSNATLYGSTVPSWTFEDGIPATSTAQNPVITFTEPGLKQLSLTSKAGNDSVWMIDNKSVFIQDSVGHYIPFTFDAEPESSLPSDNWFSINHDKDLYGWEISNEAALSGSKSFLMKNLGNCGGKKDDLIMQSLNFAPFSSVTVSFKIAFAQQDASSTDYLMAYTSDDCGVTWAPVWISGGSSLASVPPTSSFFIPAGQSDWNTHVLTIPDPSMMKKGAMLKFEFTSQGGNNLYLDDIRISGEYNGQLFLKYPENGAAGVSKDVTIDWTAVGDVEKYQFELDTTLSFNSPEYQTGEKDYISEVPVNDDTEFETSDLLLGTTYYWRARYYQAGQWSTWTTPWSFTVSEDGNNVGLDELVPTQQLKVYPNPAQNQVWLEMTPLTSAKCHVNIFDVSGRMVMAPQAFSVQAGVTSLKGLNVGELQRGMYFLVVEDDKGNRETRSLVLH